MKKLVCILSIVFMSQPFAKEEQALDRYVKAELSESETLILNADTLRMLGGENGPGNGGDGSTVKLTSFPKSSLNDAYEYMSKTFKNSKYSSKLKSEYLNELKALIKNNKIVVTKDYESFVIPGNQFSGDYTEVMRANAITKIQRGSQIILSNQTLKYSAEDLSQTLLEELGHHILPIELATDEDVVNQLALDLLDGRFDKELDEYILSVLN